MKLHLSRATLALLVVTSAPGCKPSSPADPTPPEQKLAQARQETKAAAADLNDYAYAKKAEFVQAMRDELAAVNKEIDELSNKIATATDEAKAAAQPKLEALHAQADKLKAQLDKAGDATESTWDSFKQSAGQAYGDLKQSVNDARQWLSDKIAPKSP